MENGKTLFSVTSHPTRRVAKFGISAKQLANKLLSFNKNGTSANPDTQALRFYALNQIIGAMQARFTANEKLPSWGEQAVDLYCRELVSQHNRMFWYTFLVVTREWRHLKNLSTVTSVKSKPYTPELKALHPTINDSNSESYLNAWLKHVPEMSLVDYCTCLTHSFNAGSWGGGYGGKPWGNIAQTLLNYVDGKISAEVFIDTAYTLAHNNGPMFNKGMMYSQYSNEFKIILDVQRSGQVCEGLWAAEFSTTSDTNDIRELLKDCRAELGIGEYVAWYKVETLGAPRVLSGQHASKKSKQDKLYGKKPEVILVNNKAVKVKAEYEWYPGKTVDIFERLATA
mgnify:FL=1